MWGLATHPADPNRIVAYSLFGEVYVTENAGTSWRKIGREFGEIRTAAWVPNSISSGRNCSGSDSRLRSG